MPRNNNIQFRRGDYSQWSAVSTGILANGEPGFVTDFNILKIGDGTKEWSDLPAVNDNLITIVRNDTASTINKMSLVYINGAQGDTPRVSLSIASGEGTSSKTYGMVVNNITSGNIGSVVVDGTLKNLNTLTQFSGVSPGTTLWLSPTVSGGITTTKPYAPYHSVFVGTLIRVHQTQGIINVKIQNGYELEELHNVATTGATNGQFLQYNSGSGLWFPSSSGNFTNLTINNSPIVTGTGIANHIAYWNSSSGIIADSGQLYWDSTNNRLGIAIENPQYSLQVVGTGTVQNLRVDPIISSGTLVYYNHPDYTQLTNTDIIISGQLELTRANANGIYNLAVESVWNGTGPLNTTWNAEGWSNLNSYKTRAYFDLYSAVGGNLGYNLPGAELIMRHVPTDRYWKIQFSSWTQGGAGGGFSYTRQELFSSGGTSILNGTIELNGPINKVNTSQLFATGADLAAGGQLPDIVLKGYSWFGKVDGSVGIAAYHANSGTFSSTSSFYQFGGFNESVTAYTPICFAAGNNAQLFLHTNLNVGIGTANPAYKLDINGTANVATSLRINAATTGTIASFDTNKNIVSLSTGTYPSLDELSYVKGATSNIQTQLNNKQTILTNPVTGTGIANHIAYWNSSSGIVVDSGQLYWDSTNNRLGVGTTSPSYSLDVSGIVKADSFYSTRANNVTNGSGQIFLNGPSGNRIDFNSQGLAPPSTGTRSVGTKIVLYPLVGSSLVDYALGLEAGTMWFSIPQISSRQFRWYAGTTNITTLTGAGVLTVAGATSQINVDGLRLDNNILSVTTTNDDLILKPNGNGALRTDDTGNTRGIYSVDLQRDRVSVSGVASGPYSVIAGGANNTTNNNYSTVGGGQSNTASNAWAVVCGGELNVANANRSTICGGSNNTSSDLLSTIGGGQYNISDGPYSTVPGGLRGKATRHGELSHGAGMFSNAGDAQHTILIARRLTTDSTPGVVLTLNGLAPVSTNILSIPAQTTWTFNIKLSAYNNTNNEGAWWIFRGGIRRNNSNNTVLVGGLISENYSESSLSIATATIVADNTNQALEIRVTGIAEKSIRWVAVVDISQVSFGVI